MAPRAVCIRFSAWRQTAERGPSITGRAQACEVTAANVGDFSGRHIGGEAVIAS